MSVACRSWLRRARSYRIVVDPVPELARTGRVPEEVERSRPETVARPDRLQPTYQTVLEEIRGRCRIAAEVFVQGRGAAREGRPHGEGNRHHETDDHHAGLRRWSDAGKRRAASADLRGLRAGGQHRRNRLPDTPPRPAGVAPATLVETRAKRRPAAAGCIFLTGINIS